MLNIMENIDSKDKKILYYLDMDSRSTYSQIGKKIGLSKNQVKYRIEKLQEKGIIKSFNTIINSAKLGYTSIRFHFKYQYKTPEIENKMVTFFLKYKYCTFIASTQGEFDLSMIFKVKNLNEFYIIWSEIQNKYGHYFQNQKISFFIHEIHYGSSYLIDDNLIEKEREKIREIPFCVKGIDIDDTDLMILRSIATNARLPVIDIAKKCQLTDSAVNYRIKKMKEKGIILGFRTELDLNKIGYQIIRIYIVLKEYKLRDQIINYIKNNPNLKYIDTTVGECHLELEFHLVNITQLYEIMESIIRKFPMFIRYYNYIFITNIFKYHHFPKL